MLIFILIIATSLTAAWLTLLVQSCSDDWTQATEARIIDIHIQQSKLSVKIRTARGKQSSYHSIMQRIITLMILDPLQKKLIKLDTQLELQESGILSYADILIVPGYVLQRKFETIGKSGFRKTVYTKILELYGKKNAECKTNQFFSKVLSYPIISISLTLMLGVVLLGTGNTSMGTGIIGIGTCMILVLVYGMYDELCDMTNKRRKSIRRQLPNVTSKLALLVTSGMIMDRAWKETAYSQETELYIEMRKTSEELDNLVSPETAYANFISRCNTKETAKLASAIMQSRKKGNAEIGRLLKDMAHEIWQERRHMAKRDAEKANSRLMIPTMLLFLAILVMLMVPIAMNFSGL